MKISYNWLQTYFKEPLPSPEKLEDLLTFHAFEVESKVSLENGDTMFDINVLPDRAHYALSHKGIALEVSAITGMSVSLPEAEVFSEADIEASLRVEDPLCRRYMIRKIENVTVGESPTWLKVRLQSVGQRSINNIVDATNYVMLDREQPLHAFDADKIKRGLVIRRAKNGEKIETLDLKQIELTSEMLVEADEERPLAIAGIKGGKFSGIDSNTKRIIIIAGNFEPTNIRRTSTKVGIRTDASKRFENNLSPQLPEEGIQSLTEIILKMLPQAKIGKIEDYYPIKQKQTILSVDPKKVNSALGVEIADSEMAAVLTRLQIQVKKVNEVFELGIPLYRQDLRVFEDIVEEVGRIYGYEKVKPVVPPKDDSKITESKYFYYSESVKDILVELGFSEVYLYTLVNKGEIEVAYPLASDKKALRTNLTEGVVKALDMNATNADLLDLNEIRIFEIGRVFGKSGEHTSLCVGIKNLKKKQESVNEKIRNTREHLLESLGSEIQTLCTIDDTGGLLVSGGKQIGIINNTDGILELNLDAFIESLPEPKSYEDFSFGKASAAEYKKFSLYPFIVRDIAVFIPESENSEELFKIIRAEAGELLQRTHIFDVFTKDGKTSYAFRLVLQSFERTLTDAEANAVMEKIYSKVKEKGWIIR